MSCVFSCPPVTLTWCCRLCPPPSLCPRGCCQMSRAAAIRADRGDRVRGQRRVELRGQPVRLTRRQS